jgi:hypothetical protein
MAKPIVTGGTCAPQGGQANLPAEQWALVGKGCSGALPGGGCSAGKVCQPVSPLPFLPGLCVVKPGDNNCPMGSPFSDKHVFYEGVNDTRTCSACQCGAPSGSSCDVTIEVFGDQAVNVCNTQLVSFAAGTCANLVGNPGIFGRKATITKPPNGGSCGVTGGGAPSGSITPTNATTFCCIP